MLPDLVCDEDIAVRGPFVKHRFSVIGPTVRQPRGFFRANANAVEQQPAPRRARLAAGNGRGEAGADEWDRSRFPRHCRAEAREFLTAHADLPPGRWRGWCVLTTWLNDLSKQRL